MTELLRSFGAITCHAWNADKTQVAFCPNNNEIHIYKKVGSTYEQDQILSEHDQVVTGIDWAPQSNRIVSCSHDRNAYVWKLEGSTWKPTLVILRIPRAATSVKWSPNEKKFAVASSAKCVAICFFDEENDWWVSRIVKKHKSTVLSIDWHPSSMLLLTGSSDFRARVFACYIKSIDGPIVANPFGDKLTFSDLLGEYTAARSWVHGVRWSKSGNRFAFVAHDSTCTVVDVASGAPGTEYTVPLAFLPLSDLIFANEDTIVAGGHDCSPLIISNNGGVWAFSNLIQKTKDPVAQKTGGVKQAFELFKNKVDVGANSNAQALATIHQNCITCISPFTEAGGSVSSFTTSALDGRMVLWNTA
eukprot:TRINITY_DN9473_c0_g1_i1.p1 TRINITY_DN9473_c0_g1~~TRINITY_DN9473_c0_g1_i1.p1  ORF type:complete len:375 (+),score=151.17 TRINITY_DN9473_c0_g1_i1:47-1126(+)